MAPKKRKAVAPDTTSKKRKLVVEAATMIDHSKCGKHTDAEQRKTRCSGIKADGTRCPAKIKTAASQKAISDEYLPVCGTHKHQKFKLGYCTAIAKCGQQCKRLIPFMPLQIQVCNSHVASWKGCHLLRLPMEIRQMIFDSLIPKGKIGGLRDRHCYKHIMALLLVCKQIAIDVGYLLYRSRERVCTTSILPNAITALCRTYENEARLRKSQTAHPVATSNIFGLRHFARHEIEIHISDAAVEAKSFFKLLENFQRVLFALRPPKTSDPHNTNGIHTGLGDQPSHPYDAGELVTKDETTKVSDHIIHEVATLAINVSWVGCDLIHGPFGESTLVEVFAVIKALRSVLLNTGIVAEQVSLRIGLCFQHPEPLGRAVTFSCEGKRLKIKGKGPAKNLSAAIRKEMGLLRKVKALPADHPLCKTRKIRWGLFETIAILATTFNQLDIADDQADVEKTGIPPALIYDYSYDNERTIASARYAYECGDVSTLEALLKGLEEIWQRHRDVHLDDIHSAVNALLSHHIIDRSDAETARAIATIARKERLKWPKIYCSLAFPEDAEIKNDGVYEQCKKNGQVMYRRILPSRARELREAAN